VDRNGGVPVVSRQRAMIVSLVRARVRRPVDRCRVGVRMLASDVLICVAPVGQLPVLGASRMLDEEHVAAVRALQKETQ